MHTPVKNFQISVQGVFQVHKPAQNTIL